MSTSSPDAVEGALSRLDTSAAHSARVWNYLLGCSAASSSAPSAT
jgi:hypothetical protein